MHRRDFFKWIGSAVATVAALEIDPERLLWMPGQKTFFLPPAAPSLVSGQAAVTAYREVATQEVHAALRGPHTVQTGVGACVFDQAWNLVTVNGRRATALEAARLQLGLYQYGGGSRVSPGRLSALAAELRARRALAGLHDPVSTTKAKEAADAIFRYIG